MRQRIVALLFATGCLVLPACAAAEPPKAQAPALETDDQKLFYALGIIAAARLPQFEMSADELTLVAAGLQDGLRGGDPRVDMDAFVPKLETFVRERMKASAEKEKAAGAEFVAKAAAEPGAEKLPSGLVYKELQAGTGAAPGPTDTVKVKYRGTLRDGSEFDRSAEPVQFKLNGVVPCFSEGLMKMKVGGKGKLVCPSDTAYGDQGRAPRIRPGATLVFELELVEIVPLAPAPAPAATPTP